MTSPREESFASLSSVTTSNVPIVCLHDGDNDREVTGTYGPDWRTYYTTDALGSVTGSFRFDESNTLEATSRNVYTAYGEATRSGPDAAFDGPLYAGYFFDAQTGLYQVRNRYYDPNLSNFISRDPIGYDAGDPNLYRYVANGPLGATDPMGLDEWAWNWHHLLPKQVFNEKLLKAHGLEININDAKYGWMMRAKDHLYKGGIHTRGWNPEWERWVAERERLGVRITREAVEAKMGEMIESYDLASKGFRAKYPHWLRSDAYKYAKKLTTLRRIFSEAGEELSEAALRRVANNLSDDAVKGLTRAAAIKRMKTRAGGAAKGTIIGAVFAALVTKAFGGDSCEVEAAVIDSVNPLGCSPLGGEDHSAYMRRTAGERAFVEYSAHEEELNQAWAARELDRLWKKYSFPQESIWLDMVRPYRQ